MTQTAKRLTDLMAGIHKKYYDENKPYDYLTADEDDEPWNYVGNLWVHEGFLEQHSVSIDLYHFEGDGLPVCDGLDFDGRHPDTGEQLRQHPFCICYCPEWEHPLCLLCYEAGKAGDSDDWEMVPDDVPDDVLTHIADWIETEMNKPKE